MCSDGDGTKVVEESPPSSDATIRDSNVRDGDFSLHFEGACLLLTHLKTGERVALHGLNENSVRFRPQKDGTRYSEVTAYLTYHGLYEMKVTLVGGSLRRANNDPVRFNSVTVHFSHLDGWGKASS